MKKLNINPVGLKGNEINERIIQLMGKTPIQEDLSRSVVELAKIGPDGKTYGVVRENHEYYIKVTNKTSNLVTEDFNYIGGLQNKKSVVYPSYAKAIKQLNLTFKSLAEAYGKGGDINIFENDNLMKENMGVAAGGMGFTNEGNLDGHDEMYMEESLDECGDVIEAELEEEVLEEVDLSEDEEALDDMLEEDLSDEDKEEILKRGNPEKPDPIVEGSDPQMDELMSRLDTMSAAEFLELLKDAGGDLKAKVMSMINTGADKARDYLSNRYTESEDEDETLDENLKKKD